MIGGYETVAMRTAVGYSSGRTRNLVYDTQVGPFVEEEWGARIHLQNAMLTFYRNCHVFVHWHHYKFILIYLSKYGNDFCRKMMIIEWCFNQRMMDLSEGVF